MFFYLILVQHQYNFKNIANVLYYISCLKHAYDLLILHYANVIGTKNSKKNELLLPKTMGIIWRVGVGIELIQPIPASSVF